MTQTDDQSTTDATPSSADDDREAHRRRTIIRLLVGFGIGIPVLFELATLVGLVRQSVFPGADTGGDDDGGGAGAGTTAKTERGVGVGDELLPETPQAETLTDASYRAGSEAWVLTLVAEVSNTETDPYVVQFGSVTTDGGRTVEGTSRAARVEAGATSTVTGTWQLPPGNRPASVEVRTAEGDEETTNRTVKLAQIPVEGN